MEYDDILKDLAPCGLSCRRCLAHHDGDIKKTSRDLQRLLGSFDRYAARFAKFQSVFANYPAFKELLTLDDACLERIADIEEIAYGQVLKEVTAQEKELNDPTTTRGAAEASVRAIFKEKQLAAEDKIKALEAACVDRGLSAARCKPQHRCAEPAL